MHAVSFYGYPRRTVVVNQHQVEVDEGKHIFGRDLQVIGLALAGVRTY